MADEDTDTHSRGEDTASIAELKAENQELRDRLEKLETVVSEIDTDADSVGETDEAKAAETTGMTGISRRGALTGLAGLGVLGLGATGTAAADSMSAVVSDSNGEALFADNRAGSGEAHAVNARSMSSDGVAVSGLASDTGSGLTIGVRGESRATNGRAVLGIQRSDTGPAYGVYGITESSDGIGLYGKAKSDTGQTIGLRGVCDSPDGDAVQGYNKAASGTTVGVYGNTNSPDGYGLYSETNAKIEGDLEVLGTKNFVQAVETPSGEKQVTYNAVEAGRARTETTGTIEMNANKVEVELPDHFSMVTNEDEEISAQLTPHSKTKVHPQVIECTTEKLVVEDFSDTAEKYSLSYTVKGIRAGFENKPIIENT